MDPHDPPDFPAETYSPQPCPTCGHPVPPLTESQESVRALVASVYRAKQEAEDQRDDAWSLFNSAQRTISEMDAQIGRLTDVLDWIRTTCEGTPTQPFLEIAQRIDRLPGWETT